MASGWVRVTSQPAFASFSRSSWVLGVVGMAMAWATKRSTITGPHELRSASCSSTQIAAVLQHLVGLAGDPAGLPDRHLEPGTPVSTACGSRWRRSRASAISWAPAAGDNPIARANGSGVKAATSGVPSPPSDSSASRAAPPGVSTPVSEVAGWRSAQWAASSGSAERGSSFGLFGFGGGFEHTGRVEVADLVLLPDRGAHGTKPSTDHRHSRPRIPCIHRGFGAS